MKDICKKFKAKMPYKYFYLNQFIKYLKTYLNILNENNLFAFMQKIKDYYNIKIIKKAFFIKKFNRFFVFYKILLGAIENFLKKMS